MIWVIILLVILGAFCLLYFLLRNVSKTINEIEDDRNDY